MSDMNKKQLMCGLSDSQVNESKAKYGTNELAKKETESLWSMFIGAFDDIWIKVLCAALALKVILAILGIFVPALSGGNDVVEIISIVIAIALATALSGYVRVPVHLLPKNILRSGFPLPLRAVLYGLSDVKSWSYSGWYVYISAGHTLSYPRQSLQNVLLRSGRI